MAAPPAATPFRDLLDHGPDPIGIHQDGVLVYVNHAFVDLLGARSPEELIGRSLIEMVPEKFQSTVRSQMTRMIQGKSHSDIFDSSIIGVDGKLRDVEVSSTYVEWENRPAIMGSLRELGPRLRGRRETLISQRLLQATLDSIPHAIFVKDTDLRFTLFNQKFIEVHRMAEEELIGRRSEDLKYMPEELRRHFEVQDRQVLETGQANGIGHMEIPRLDGSVSIFRNTKLPVRDEEGNVVFVVGIAEDITEQVKNERKILAGEGKYRDLVDNSLQGLVILDMQAHLLFGNPAFPKIWGYNDLLELLGKNVVETIVAPEDRERLRGYTRARREGGEAPERYEYQGIRKDGTRIWLENLVKKVIWEGEPALQVVMIDITRRKQAEEDAEAGRRLLMTVFDSIPHRLFVKDRESRYLIVNQAMSAFLGLNPPDLAGKRYQELNGTIGSEGELFQEIDERVMATGKPYDESETITNPNSGRPEITRVIKVPLQDRDESIVGLVGMAENITGLHAMEEQLRQAQKMEAIGQLAGGVAHDFNNLLTVLMGNLELLEYKLKAGDIPLELIRRAMDAASRGASLTQRLLAFSRQQSLSPRLTDLNALIRNQLEWLASMLGETVEVEPRLADGLWPTMIDPAQMESSLVNLALNARDAMENQGTMTITTANINLSAGEEAEEQGLAPGDWVRVSVGDTGKGIPETLRSQVFEPFFTTKDVGKGSGLGLSMIYGLMAQSGGHIAVESREGAGSIFHLWLPRASAEGDAVEPVPESVPAAAGAEQELVLVVEDDPNVRSLAESVVSNLGYAVVSAPDSPDALRLLESELRVRVLFSDVVLPGGRNGIDLAREAKQLQPALGVLLTSGYSEYAASHQDWLDEGVYFLRKPYRIDDLAAMLTRVLEKS